MKVNFGKIFLSLFAVTLAALPLSGCAERAKTAEELIPDTVGEPEGLWLYKGELRSRTDGSDSERLFDSIAIDGTEYTYDKFSVCDYLYSTAAHSVTYLINADGYGYFLYLFDYKDKTGKFLRDAPDGDIEFTTSDKLTYAHFDGAGYLFDDKGELLCDKIDGTLKNGILYALRNERVEGETCYIDWYCNGYRSAALPNTNAYASYDVEICGNYIYILSHDEPEYAIEKNTGKVTQFDIFDVSFDPNKYVDSYRNVEERFYYDGDMYIFSVVYRIIDRGDENREGKDEWYWYLHKVDGDRSTLECEFGEVRRGVIMGVSNGKFYFQARTGGNLYQKHYLYDPATGKLKSISKAEFRSGGIPKNPQTPVQGKNPAVKVNGYEFSVSSRMYGYSGFLNGPEGYCYYLNRKHDGVTEIMQYSFKNNYFYDDICDY